MPCICWFEPQEEDKKILKQLCQQVVDKVKSMENIGDPIGMDIESVKILIEHLYDTTRCKEKE